MNVALGIVLLGMAAETKTLGPPAEIDGTWDVDRVMVDNEDGLHWEVRPDDPQLLGRALVIGADRVNFEDGKELGCKPSTWPARQTTWGDLFAKGFVRPAEGGRNPVPKPEDFDLKVAKSQAVRAYSLCPSSGRRDSRFPQDHWVALYGADRLALHYSNQTLLLLRRRPPGAKPTASFDCAKAAIPTERTICRSFDLASWDRSVAMAFHRALERQTPEKQAEIRLGQMEWLRKRNACGGSADCIDEHLWRRVEELRQE